MGIFSGGGAFNKSSSSSTTNNTKNTGFNFSEVSGVASASNADVSGLNNTVNMLDGGAIAGAFDFSGKAVGESLFFARESSEDAYAFAKAALVDSMGIAGEIVKESSALTANVAAKAVQDESDKVAELSRWLIGGVVVVAFVAAAMALKGIY
jgi:hypothetical protein